MTLIFKKQLIVKQKKDDYLLPLFDQVLPEDELVNVATGYFEKAGVLMRKWHPPTVSV